MSEAHDPHRKMVKELLDDESDRLTRWECDFLDSMHKWTGEYTPKQAEIIKRIWSKIYG